MSFGEFVEGFVTSVSKAVEPLARTFANMAERLNRAFTPLFARMRPWETGRELAELCVEEQLTAAERYPVRATTTYDEDAIDVEYNDGTGWDRFVTYSADAIEEGRSDA